MLLLGDKMRKGARDKCVKHQKSPKQHVQLLSSAVTSSSEVFLCLIYTTGLDAQFFFVACIQDRGNKSASAFMFFFVFFYCLLTSTFISDHYLISAFTPS